MGFILLFFFIGVPLVEIMLFIKIGGVIGMTMTILVVIVTALLGSFLLRAQGLATMRGAQTSMDRGELPMDSVIHGIFLLLAGAFLLTPGFLTDAVGFLLFIPPIRLALGRQILSAVMARSTVSGSVSVGGSARTSRQTWQSGSWQPGDPDGPIIDAEASEVDDDKD